MNFKEGDKVWVVANTVDYDLLIGSMIILGGKKNPDTFYYRDRWFVSIYDIELVEDVKQSTNRIEEDLRNM